MSVKVWSVIPTPENSEEGIDSWFVARHEPEVVFWAFSKEDADVDAIYLNGLETEIERLGAKARLADDVRRWIERPSSAIFDFSTELQVNAEEIEKWIAAYDALAGEDAP